MDRTDGIILWVLTALAFLTVVLRVLLAKKQEKPLSVFWLVQSFVFPVILLVTSILFQTGTDIVFPAILIGVIEELILGTIRRRKQKM